MKCERVRIYSWTGNEVWECKGRTLPPPESHSGWLNPEEWSDYHAHHQRWLVRSYAFLDPTAES